MYIYYGCTVCRVWFINSFRLHLEYKIRNIKTFKTLAPINKLPKSIA